MSNNNLLCHCCKFNWFVNKMETINLRPLKGIEMSCLFREKNSALLKLNFFIHQFKRSEKMSDFLILKPADSVLSLARIQLPS